MTLKKLALLSLLNLPIAIFSSDQTIIPVLTLPINLPPFGIITAQIQDSQKHIDSLRHALSKQNRILLISAHPSTPNEQLPHEGIYAQVLAAQSGWGYLEITTMATGRSHILEFIPKDGLLHARIEMVHENETQSLNTNPDETSKQTKKSPRQIIQELPLSSEDKQELMDQLSSLEQMRPDSPEYSMTKRYIDLVISLPWNTQTTDNLDLKHVKDILDRDHHGLEKIKERILDFIAVRKLNPTGNGKILCLVGPPGTGKTSICKSIAESMGRKYERVALGGLKDESEVRGHRRTYIGALPGRIIQAIKKAQSKNPVMVLDEIDKVAAHHRGDPTAALLELLDPEQNNAFYDNYLAVPFDLSKVMFIATANNLDTIPGPLLDRMEIIELSGYTLNEKVHIAQKHVVAKAIKATGLQPEDVTICSRVLERIVSEYTREAGIRDLERVIKQLCQKAAREKVENNQKITFTPENLEQYLDAPKYPRDLDDHKHRIGVAHGLAWTAVGGTTLDMESILMPGDGKIILTGKLGEVMQESAKAAMSYAKAHAHEFGINPELFKTKDIHVHAPAGAIPKDGPSAGVTLLTAIISALTDKPVNGTYAMTGEINLHGDVLPIGGVKEKIIAAKQQNYQHVIVPFKNKNDIKALSADVLKGVNIIYAKHADDVLKHVFNLSQAGIVERFWPFTTAA